MCAIAGVLGMPLSRDSAGKLLNTMVLRGPDGQGLYECPGGTLLHSRLAIMDPQGGQQPMVLAWAGETYVLVYNGELYNTEELRRELKKLGHSFLGHSDTEVLLHSYAQWGEDCLQKCNGIFAFAIWEEKGQRLFLARDRIGVKPLFYMEQKGSLLFASEMKTILAVPGIRARLDVQGAMELLLLGPGRLPGSGVFHNIRELEPGCCAIWEQGRLQVRRYWRLLDREHPDSFEQTVEKVRFLVTDAIRRQMVSDVPIGTFLSGGLDSSIISAVCAEKLQERGARLQTFSLDYRDNAENFRPNRFQPESDTVYIRLMEQELNTRPHWTVLSPQDLVDTLEDATIARDLPGMADVDFSLLAFCRRIREHGKVALSGECADEIFGGYPWYRDPQIRAAEGFPWAQNTAERCSLLLPSLGRDGEDFVREAYEATCRESDILPGTSPLERRMKEMVNLNFRWFMQTLLDRKDRMSMYCGLEVRVPFCDWRIAEYLYGVPWEYKDYEGREKGLLRKAMEGILPDAVLYRKKSPYPKTFDPAYAQMIRTRFEALLEDRASPVYHLVSADAMGQILTGERRTPWYGQLMGVPQTMAYFLQLDFWLRQYQVELLF